MGARARGSSGCTCRAGCRLHSTADCILHCRADCRLHCGLYRGLQCCTHCRLQCSREWGGPGLELAVDCGLVEAEAEGSAWVQRGGLGLVCGLVCTLPLHGEPGVRCCLCAHVRCVGCVAWCRAGAQCHDLEVYKTSRWEWTHLMVVQESRRCAVVQGGEGQCRRYFFRWYSGLSGNL